MMHMKINGGSMSIDDNNKTTASANVAKEIYDNCITPDEKNVGNEKDGKTNTGNGFKPDIDIND